MKDDIIEYDKIIIGEMSRVATTGLNLFDALMDDKTGNLHNHLGLYHTLKHDLITLVCLGQIDILQYDNTLDLTRAKKYIKWFLKEYKKLPSIFKEDLKNEHHFFKKILNDDVLLSKLLRECIPFTLKVRKICSGYNWELNRERVLELNMK